MEVYFVMFNSITDISRAGSLNIKQRKLPVTNIENKIYFE